MERGKTSPPLFRFEALASLILPSTFKASFLPKKKLSPRLLHPSLITFFFAAVKASTSCIKVTRHESFLLTWKSSLLLKSKAQFVLGPVQILYLAQWNLLQQTFVGYDFLKTSACLVFFSRLKLKAIIIQNWHCDHPNKCIRLEFWLSHSLIVSGKVRIYCGAYSSQIGTTHFIWNVFKSFSNESWSHCHFTECLL